tara:strand:+ start:218 stop:868 length:651 start_codon:yes stop_codon:yes gene_type:complete
MTPNTKKQISGLSLDPTLPLMIFDADEVLVHFAEPFANYLKKHNHRLHLTGYRLDNAIKIAETDDVADPDTAKDLVWGFINEETKNQPAAKGAPEALKKLQEYAQIIILSNVPHSVHDDRVFNLKSIDMDYPLISNEGMKGPAVKEILKNHKAVSFFIDDNPYQVESVYNDNQDTVCVHFSVCDLVKPYMPKAVGASIEPTSWDDLVLKLINYLKG